MSRIFHRDLRNAPPIAVRGEGLYIVDAEGRRYLDACGGAAVSCLGHSAPEATEAIARQAERLAYAHTGFFSSEPAEELAELLISDAPAGLERVYFLGSGSEAVEAAVKMAHQYHRERGDAARRHVIGRWQSYHGNTLGALSAGGNRFRRALYQDLLIGTTLISPCFAYRGQEPDETLEAYGRRVADELEAAILELGHETVSCFVAEPVVGATLGAVLPAPGYFRRIREICDRYGVLLILDEVMCGLGRTGVLHACEAEGVSPDLMTLAKGLGAGFQPLGALLASGRVVEAFASGSGAFQHGHTYVGHPVACAAGLAVQRVLRERNLVDNVARQGVALEGALRERLGDHPHVGDIRGRGLFYAVELVRDRETKEPFDPALRLNARIKAQAMELGLLCYAMPGTLDGRRGDHVMLAPPFVVNRDDVVMMADLLAAAVAKALDGVDFATKMRMLEPSKG